MIQKHRQMVRGNLWNRLARDLIYDSKQLLLQGGVRIPMRSSEAATADEILIDRVTRGTQYGAIYDPAGRRIHFEPVYIQNIVDLANRFDFPVFDKSFGAGGIAGFIETEGDGNGNEENELRTPTLNHILQQAMLAKKHDMPFAFVSARRLSQLEVEQVGVMTQVFDGPIFLNVSTPAGIAEVEKAREEGHYIITNHTIFDSPLTLSAPGPLEIFVQCVERKIPVMLTTQPFSGQTGPITPYGLALLAFSEFLAGMAIAYAIHPETKVVNGAYPTMCTPGRKPELKIGSVVHNFVNYLVSYTARLLDIASIQSGCTVQGKIHRNTILETDYETIRGMILWECIFEGWHMLRHSYGFLGDLVSFSFPKAKDDIVALRHIQSLDDDGINAVLANNVRLNHDIQKAKDIYENPKLIFDRDGGAILNVIIETADSFRGDFGKHSHTLENIPAEWF